MITKIFQIYKQYRNLSGYRLKKGRVASFQIIYNCSYYTIPASAVIFIISYLLTYILNITFINMIRWRDIYRDANHVIQEILLEFKRKLLPKLPRGIEYLSLEIQNISWLALPLASMYSFNDFSLSPAYMAISEPMVLTLYTRNLPQNLQRVDFVTYQKV